MANFAPVSAAIGGALIGFSAVLLMLFTGRIAGISGIVDGLINQQTSDRAWRAAFVAGLIAAPVTAMLVGYTVPMPQLQAALSLSSLAASWSGSGPASAAAAPRVTAYAASRGCHHVRSRPPACLRWRQWPWSPCRGTSSEAEPCQFSRASYAASCSVAD